MTAFNLEVETAAYSGLAPKVVDLAAANQAIGRSLACTGGTWRGHGG